MRRLVLIQEAMPIYLHYERLETRGVKRKVRRCLDDNIRVSAIFGAQNINRPAFGAARLHKEGSQRRVSHG